ncbi:MAG: hypothetical protein Q8O25_00395 [Sulfurisoma sp.]|nr:hypothetical protein [Sulfurisoma sp.]
MNTTSLENNVDILWQQLRQSVAQPAAWLALARDYARHDLPW